MARYTRIFNTSYGMFSHNRTPTLILLPGRWRWRWRPSPWHVNTIVLNGIRQMPYCRQTSPYCPYVLSLGQELRLLPIVRTEEWIMLWCRGNILRVLHWNWCWCWCWLRLVKSSMNGAHVRIRGPTRIKCTQTPPTHMCATPSIWRRSVWHR